MKKVLVVINNLGVGGAERLVVDDINEMLKRDLDVHLLTFKKESDNTLSSGLNLPKDKWKFIEAKTIWDFSIWFRVYGYLKSIKPDIIFNHLWFSNTILVPISRLAGISEIIAFEHNVYDLVKNRRMYFVDRLIQNLPKKIVAVSSAVKDSLISHGIKEKRIVVINNGIDLSKYKKEKNKEYRKNIDLPQDVFVFVTVGRLIDQKGIDVLIRAFSLGLENSHLLIVGQGKKENELKKLTSDLNLGDKVHFLGARNDIPDILASCDCFVLASRWEGLGIAVLEAMASKLPIILTDFEAGRDMVVPDKSGIVVPIDDIEGLFNAMRKIYLNGLLREELSSEAYESSRRFGIESHVSNIMSL